MENISLKKDSLTIIKGSILAVVIGALISLGLGLNIKDSLFVEGLIISILGILSLINGDINEVALESNNIGKTFKGEISLIDDKKNGLLEVLNEKINLFIGTGVFLIVLSYIM